MIDILIAIIFIWIGGFIVLAILGAIFEEGASFFDSFRKDEPYIVTSEREDHTNWID